MVTVRGIEFRFFVCFIEQFYPQRYSCCHFLIYCYYRWMILGNAEQKSLCGRYLALSFRFSRLSIKDFVDQSFVALHLKLPISRSSKSAAAAAHTYTIITHHISVLYPKAYSVKLLRKCVHWVRVFGELLVVFIANVSVA